MTEIVTLIHPKKKEMKLYFNQITKLAEEQGITCEINNKILTLTFPDNISIDQCTHGYLYDAKGGKLQKEGDLYIKIISLKKNKLQCELNYFGKDIELFERDFTSFLGRINEYGIYTLYYFF